MKKESHENSSYDFMGHWNQFGKLEPFGFSIHGFVAGYLRRSIWLEASTSNKCPNLIVPYYLTAATILHGIPKMVNFPVN